MKLTLIPAGEFTMGSPPDEADRGENEGPEHRVRITRPFYLGTYEVTKGQFAKFVAATGYRTEAERDGRGSYGWNGVEQTFEGPNPKYTWRNWGVNQSDESPVVNVTWNDAVAFCQWLSREEGKEYRLPTEAEWEYACRGGTTTAYQHGNDPEGLVQTGNVWDAAAKKFFSKNYSFKIGIAANDGWEFTAPVGKFRPNGFGLHDMHGNVWEWCADWFDEGYYSSSPSADPPGPSSGSYRVFRGGSWAWAWLSAARFCRSANRYGNDPSLRLFDLGFRCALSPSGN